MFSRPVNVCHLGKYYPPATGGIESHVQTLARAQSAAGANVRVVCINHLNREGVDITWSRYGATRTVHDCDGDVRVTRLGRSASVARFDVIPSLPKALYDLQYSPVDIIHLHTPNPTMLLTLAALRINKPIVVTHHSDVISQRWLVHVMRPLERIVYGRASAVICGSEAYANASAVLQRFDEKVVVLPLGCDLQPYLTPSPGALAFERDLGRRYGDQPLWLSVGRCVYYKGLHTAIAALARAPGRLMIVGQGPLQSRLQTDARRLGVADRVIWWGWATDDELAGAYRAATALWFPSNARSEAFGLVQVEAMASGCPVINTNIAGSGVSWVSRDGESGLTVEVEDPTALAAAATRLAGDPALRRRLAAGARERATGEFAQGQMAARSLQLYSRLLKAAQTGGRVVDAVAAPRPRLESWIKQSSDARYDALEDHAAVR